MKLKHLIKKAVHIALVLPAFIKRRNKRMKVLPHSILVINFGLIGDVLMVTPLLEEIRRTLPPDADITIAVQPCSLAAVKNNPHINHIITYNSFWSDPTDNGSHKVKIKHLFETIKFIRVNRKHKYDLIINSWITDQPLVPFVSSFLSYELMIGFDFNYSSKYNDYSYIFDYNQHVTDNMLRMYCEHIGVDTKVSNLRYTYKMSTDYSTPDYEEIRKMITGRYVIVSPFSSQTSKEWSLENWGKTIEHIYSCFPYFTLVLTGQSKSVEDAKELAAMVTTPIINTVGKLTLDQFAHLCMHSAAIITVESGTMHFAGVYNKPVFIILSRLYNFNQFIPYNVKYRYNAIDVDCANCIYGCKNMDCMKHDQQIISYKLTDFIKAVESGER
ncbi:MAG: glycosyltransferase family 9 protein [Desulfuromonadaceae bacterium]